MTRPGTKETTHPNTWPLSKLFICTGKTARSSMAQVLLVGEGSAPSVTFRRVPYSRGGRPLANGTVRALTVFNAAAGRP